MKIRRTLATALAAGTLVLGFGIVAPAAHANSSGGGTITVNPCVLNPSSCLPQTPPGGVIQVDPCLTVANCPPPLPTPPKPRDPGTTDTTPPPPHDTTTPAPPAVSVRTTVSFTG